MARNLLTRRRPAELAPAPGTQTAAVQRLDLPPLATGNSEPWKGIGRPLAWQQEAYRHYDRCGELHFCANTIASMASRVNIAIWKKTPDGEPGEPVTDGKVGQLSASLGGGGEGRAELLRLSVLNDFLVGDYYTAVETPKEKDQPDRWFVLSVSQIAEQSGRLTFERPPKHGGGEIVYQLPKPGASAKGKTKNDVILWRTFQEHAQLTHQPDSSVRAAIPILNLIEQYDKRASAQNDSRLAGAGVLFLPSGFDFPIPPPGPPGSPPGPATPTDAFEARLGDAMGKTLRDPGNARSLVPIMATVNPEHIKDIKWLTFETPLDEQTMTRLDQCIRRLGLALDMPPELLTGVASMNHWCVDTETQILTSEGWKHQNQLAAGDIVLTLNHKTGLSEWQPVLDIYRAHVDAEPMRSLERRNHSSLTTANHRWATIRNGRRVFVHTDELSSADKIPTGAQCADVATEPKYSDDLVELVAWYWTEGSCSQRRVSIAQSHTVNSRRVERIRACLTRLFGVASIQMRPGSPQWREAVQHNRSSHGGPVTVFYLNRDAGQVLKDIVAGTEKIVPLDFVRSLTKAQLELFIDVSCQADGWHYRAGRLDMWQRNAANLPAFELALILSGRMVTTGMSGDGSWVSPHNQSTVRPIKGISGRRPPQVQLYTGTVWCPVTPNGTWFAKRRGTSYFTGNSAWAAEQSTHKVFVASRVARWCHGVTTGWMTPMLQAMSVDPNEYMVWFDLSPLTVRPDRQADALALWDRGLIQDQVVLDAGNWPATAAHTEETYRRWIITQSIIKNPQLLADPSFAATIGIQAAQAPIQAQTAVGDTQAPAAIEAAPETTPAEPTSTRTPAQQALVTGAEMAAMHSLAVAGKKLLRRDVRDQLLTEFAGRPFDLHTRLPVTGADHAAELLDNTWDLLPVLSARTGTDQRILREALTAYCAGQMVSARPHDPDALTLFLSEGILAAGHRFCGPAGCRNRLHPQPCELVAVAA